MRSTVGMPTPSRLRVALQAARRTQLAGRRLAAWALQPGRWTRPVLAPPAEAFAHDLYDVRVPLLRRDPAADPRLEAGKRVNVALAACAFDGLLLTPAQPLSFWRTLGRVTPEAGFQLGMELRGGCIVPTVGGGVCLLSNALFAMAARLGWAVLERHGHSLEAVPPTDGGPWGARCHGAVAACGPARRAPRGARAPRRHDRRRHAATLGAR